MVDEIVAVFEPVPAGTLLDATLGGGGHAEALLERCPQLSVLGLDRDQQALDAARHRLDRFGPRVTTVQAASTASPKCSPTPASTVSRVRCSTSACRRRNSIGRARLQLSPRRPTRHAHGSRGGRTADDVVNGYDQGELARVIREYGDERFAGRIARAIVAGRPVTSTTELAAIVAAAIPAATRRTGGHPAKRTFQAIRIEVNSELDQLPGALDQAIDATVAHGRVAVLTYHSGEDRVVKQRFTEATTGACTCPAGLPCVCGAAATVRRVPRPHAVDRSGRAQPAGPLRPPAVVEKLAAAP